MTPPPRSPSVDPAELRPGRFWYGIAIGVVVLGVALSVVVVVVSIQTAVGSLPELEQEFGPEETVSIELPDNQAWAIYAVEPGSVSAADCQVKSPDGDAIRPRTPSGSASFGSNGRNWKLMAEFVSEGKGEHQISCQGTPGTELAVGETMNTGAFVGSTFGIVAGILGGVCLPGLIGGVIALVVGMKRSSHKKRLLRERTWGY